MVLMQVAYPLQHLPHVGPDLWKQEAQSPGGVLRIITIRAVARRQARPGKWPSAGRWRGLKHRLGVAEIQGFCVPLSRLGTTQLEEGATYVIINRIAQCTTCTALHVKAALSLNSLDGVPSRVIGFCRFFLLMFF